MFTEACQWEIERRQAGKVTYGNAKIYGVAHCKNEIISIGGKGEMTRE
jgi:hypothetical protein